MRSRTERERTTVTAEAHRRSWLTWGATLFIADLVIHSAAGSFRNDWEGWGVALENTAFVAITGAVVVGLTYGIFARRALQAPQNGPNRPAKAALIAGILSVAAYGAFPLWAPFLVAPAAVLLGREGLRRATAGHGRRGYALTGTILGLVSFTVMVGLVTFAVITGNYPFGI
jgi:hypothetical protein